MRNLLLLALTAAAVFFATASLAFADTHYARLGISNRDLQAYKKLSITSCTTARQENRNPMNPPANIHKLRNLARLYARCQSSLEARHASLGVLRVNDMFLGETCIALGLVDTNDPVMRACNIKSYLPGSRPGREHEELRRAIIIRPVTAAVSR